MYSLPPLLNDVREHGIDDADRDSMVSLPRRISRHLFIAPSVCHRTDSAELLAYRSIDAIPWAVCFRNVAASFTGRYASTLELRSKMTEIEEFIHE
jgi:hypothetical protein